LLADNGYDAEVAFDGQEGLDVLARWPAGLDGLSFLK